MILQLSGFPNLSQGPGQALKHFTRSRVLRFIEAARKEEMEVDLGIRSSAKIRGAEPLYFLNTIKWSAADVGVTVSGCFLPTMIDELPVSA